MRRKSRSAHGFIRSNWERFKQVPKEAEAMLKVGNTKRNGSVPLAEAAAATVLGQALLNHDECVVRR